MNFLFQLIKVRKFIFQFIFPHPPGTLTKVFGIYIRFRAINGIINEF